MKLEPSESFRTDDTSPDDEEQSENVILTLEQALSDADFGAYVSVSVPSQFFFASAQKTTGYVDKSLSVLWEKAAGSNDGTIVWRISKSAADEFDHVVYVHEREKYDTALYSFPWDTSVPEELQRFFENPLFLSEELTLDTLLARSYHADDDKRESLGIRMDFSVLYGDVVVLVNTKGASPEQLFEMFGALNSPEASYKGSDKTGNLASTDDR